MGAALVAILAIGFFLVASVGGDSPPAASGDTTSTTASTTTSTTTTTTTLPPTTLAPTTQPVVVTNPPGNGDGRSSRRCRRIDNQIQDVDERLAEIQGDGSPLEQELQARRAELQAEHDDLHC